MRNQRNIALVKAKPGARVFANQRHGAKQEDSHGRNQGRQARQYHIHSHRLAGHVDGEPSVSREGTCRARRVRPYHGRVGVFIYYRQIVRAYDPVTTVCVAFLLGMLIAFCWCYSCYMSDIIRFGQTHLGW